MTTENQVNDDAKEYEVFVGPIAPDAPRERANARRARAGLDPLPSREQIAYNRQQDARPEGFRTNPPPSAGTNTGNIIPTSVAPTLPKRKFNPLSAYASYTYQLSLYMITPTAYDAFVASGRTQINSLVDADNKSLGGTYLVAQSGGVNNSTNIRASTDELNYYIDDLSIKSMLMGKATMSSSVDTEIKFKITEPYGFSFLSDLKRVADIIYSNSSKTDRPQNALRQFFVLGVKFNGYDKDGNIINTVNAPVQTEANSDLSRVSDKYYDILITDIKFKLSGNAVVYDVTARALPTTVGLGVQRGMVTTSASLDASTVEDAVKKLIQHLNTNQESIERRVGRKLNRYNYRFAPSGPESERIRTASILTKTEIQDFNNKWNIPSSDAQNVQEANDGQSNTVDLTSRIIQIKNDTPIQQAITQIITQSAFLTDSLNILYASQNQPDPVTGDLERTIQAPSTGISFFSFGVEIRNAEWVSEIKDFVYEIVYVIQPYKTPVIQSPYGIPDNTYYGPHKRYDYWYTGKNSEVINYSQDINLGYYTIFMDVTTPNMQTGVSSFGFGEVPMNPQQPSNQSRLGTVGQGREAQNTVMTSLFDPASFARAKIEILGDPDLLMPENLASENGPYDVHYGVDGFTANPYGGQIFIEIDFKEARDIDTKLGYQRINDRILFWKYPEEVSEESKKIEGISYMLVDALHTFKGGSFKQLLNCIINPLSFGAKRTPQETVPNSESQREPPRVTVNPRDPSGPGDIRGRNQIGNPVFTNPANDLTLQALNTLKSKGLTPEPPANISSSGDVGRAGIPSGSLLAPQTTVPIIPLSNEN